MPTYGSNSKIWGSKKGEFFDISKIGTFWPSKWPISDIFKNLSQGVKNTIFHTYGQILDQISESQVPLKLSQMCSKMSSVFDGLWLPLKCVATPKMVPPYSLGTCPPWTNKIYGELVAPSLRKKLIFSRHPILANYSNGPGVGKNWHMSKLTKKGPRRCHKLSWVQIWQKNSNGKCSKLPKRNFQSLRYNRDGVPWGMGHMGDGAHGQWCTWS